MTRYVQILFCLIAMIPLAVGTGRLQIRYISFNTRGLDSNGIFCDSVSECDPIFMICLRLRSSTSLFTCSSSGVTAPIITTGEFDDTDVVNFGSVIGSRTNPVRYLTDDSFNGNFEILIEAEDDDIVRNDEIDSVYIRGRARASFLESAVMTFTGERNISPATASISYRLICDSGFTGEFCTVVDNLVSPSSPSSPTNRSSSSSTVRATTSTPSPTTQTPRPTTFFQREDFKYYVIGFSGSLLLILITIAGCIGGGVCLCIFCNGSKTKISTHSWDIKRICGFHCSDDSSILVIILCIILFSPLLLLLIPFIIVLIILLLPILAILGMLYLLFSK